MITTNYLEEAQALCERLAIIDHGKLVALDTPEHLKHTYGGSVVEVETARPMTAVEELRTLPGVKEVKAQGTHLTITTEGVHIAVREPTLDEIFLRLTGTELRD